MSFPHPPESRKPFVFPGRSQRWSAGLVALSAILISCSTVWALTPGLVGSPTEIADTSRWEKVGGAWEVVDGHLLNRDGGMLVLREPVPSGGDFSIEMQMRFDQLRWLGYPPGAGVVFDFVDRRNYRRITLHGYEAQVVVDEVREGKEERLATSKQGFLTEVGRPFYLRVERKSGHLSVAFSDDAKAWRTSLEKECPEPAPPFKGRIGLAGGLPAVRISWGGSEISSIDPPHDAGASLVPGMAYLPCKKPPGSEDYRAALQRVLEDGAKTRLPSTGVASAAQAALAKADGSVSDAAVARAQMVLANYERLGRFPLGFHDFAADMECVLHAKAAGWLTEAQTDLAKRMAAESLAGGSYERGPMNRALGNLIGIAPARELAGTTPFDSKLEQVIKSVEQDFEKARFQPMEDSANYLMLSLLFAMEHADKSRPDWWSEPDFRLAFDNLRDLVSPGGYIPAFGDDGISHPGLLIGLMERAAAAWGDGRFRAAAWLVWNRYFSDGRTPAPETISPDDVLGLALAAQWAKDPVAPTDTPAPPVRLLRLPNGKPWKAILTGGDTWTLIDLHVGGEHGHNDALAVVAVVRNREIVLTDNGRYAHGATFHNRPVVVHSKNDLPLSRDLQEQSRRMRQRHLRPEEWNHYRLPLSHHYIWGNFQGDMGLPTLHRGQYHPDIPHELSPTAKQASFLLDFRGMGGITAHLRNVQFEMPQGVSKIDLAKTVREGEPGAPRVKGGEAAWRMDLVPDSQYVGIAFPNPFPGGEAREGWLNFDLLVEEDPGARAILCSVVLGDSEGYPKRWLDEDNGAGQVSAEILDEGRALKATLDGVTSSGQAYRIERRMEAGQDGSVKIADQFENKGEAAVAGATLWHAREWQRTDNKARAGNGSLWIQMGNAEDLILSTNNVYGLEGTSTFWGYRELAPGACQTINSQILFNGMP